MSNKYVKKLPEECKAKLQDFVGEGVDLDKVVLHVSVESGDYFNVADITVVTAFIGYAINFYRLFTRGGVWVISVDESVPLEDLQAAVDDDNEEDW